MLFRSTVADLRVGLAASGFAVSRRTVERDLHQVSSAGFPVVCHTRDGVQHWGVAGQAPRWLPTLPSVSDAVLLVLARAYLTPLLPPPMRRALAPTFAQAEAILQTARATQPLARWHDKVRATLPTQRLLAPDVAADVADTCTEALLFERCLRVTYNSRSRRTAQYLTLHPLGLVQRGLVTYLIATADPHQDARLYAVHRFRRVQMLPTAVVRPAGFDLDGFLHTGLADFGRGRRIRLVLRVAPEVATHLTECRLSADQTVRPVRSPSGWFRVQATVYDTPQLHWWIQGFGAQMQVEAPRAHSRTPSQSNPGGRRREPTRT